MTDEKDIAAETPVDEVEIGPLTVSRSNLIYAVWGLSQVVDLELNEHNYESEVLSCVGIALGILSSQLKYTL